MSQAGSLNNGGGGSGTTIEKINVQTGTSPVVTANNTITFNGAVVAAGTHPVRTDGTAPATMALEVQTAQAIASTDATKIGLAAFNSADFTVDANGFVSSTSGGSGIVTIDGNTGSVTGATVSIKTPASTGTLNFSGSGTAMTLNLMDGSGDLAIGNSATATGGNSVCLGTSATDSALAECVVIGNTSQCNTGATQGVAIGNGAVCGAANNIAIGTGTTMFGTNGVGIGSGGVSDTGHADCALYGNLAVSFSTQSVAVGSGATIFSSSDGSVAIGYTAHATSNASVAIGNTATSASNGVSIGNGSSSNRSVCIGNGATDGGGTDTTCVGPSATSTGGGSTSIGAGATCSVGSTVAIGAFAGSGGGGNNVSLGVASSTTGSFSIAVGTSANDSGGTDNVALGATSKAPSGGSSISLGFGAGSANSSGANNITIGNVGVSAETNVIRIGTQGSGTGEQDACYVAGIFNTDSSGFTSPLAVFVDSSTGQLGFGSGGGGSGIVTINGNTGSVTGATVSIETPASTGTLNFSGSGTAMTLNITDGSRNLAIGDSAISTGGDSIALGTQSSATGINSVCIGPVAVDNGGASNVAIGQAAQAPSAGNGVVIGPGASSASGSTVCIGQSATITGSGNAIAIGPGCSSSSVSSVAIGQACAVSGGISTCVGAAAKDNGGTQNVSIGGNANTPSGGNSISLGYGTGINNTTGASNIMIGHWGVAAESNVTRIGYIGGTTTTQTACYIDGIAGATVSNSAAVLIDTTTGQLGTIPSSLRYKENVTPASNTSALYDLNVCNFNYKSDPHKRTQFGLIAEEVHKVMPSLVIYDGEGRPDSVKYHELPVLLLAEIQKLKSEIAILRGK